MSGPKVVRIVTREEIEAVCLQSIRAVEEAAEELRRRARRYDMFDQGLDADLQQRRQDLLRLFEAERWADLRSQAVATSAFLRQKASRIEEQAIAAAEAKRSKGRMMSAAARTLIAALESQSQLVSPELHEIVSQAAVANEGMLASMQHVLNDAFRKLLPAHQTRGLTEAQRQLANQLGVGQIGQSFIEWLATQQTPTSNRDARLDALLAEIEVTELPSVVENFVERANAISREISANRRALLTDSLILEASDRARRRRAEALFVVKLQEARAALAPLSSTRAKQMQARISAALEGDITGLPESLVAEAHQIAETEIQELAAIARRRAVLSGLAALGYEVRETLGTALARDGRIFVRKPGATDYGIELGAPPDASRLQVRLVGADSPAVPRDERRDRDQEVMWCSEFSELRALLAQQGGEVILERAFDAGVQPVKTVTFGWSVEEASGPARVPTATRTVR